MLEDSAHIQASDAAHIAKLIARGVDLEPVTPLYDSDGLDVVQDMHDIESCQFLSTSRFAA